MPRIYIDVESGTWGDADRIVFAEATDDDLDFLDGASDEEIRFFAINKEI